MATKRTVDTGYFGSLGLGDAMSTFAEKTYRVSWDFAKKNVTQKAYQGGNVVIPLMQLPKGFCIDRISVVQTKTTASNLTVTFGLLGDDSFTVGGNFTLNATEANMIRSSQSAKATAVAVTKTDNVYVSTASGSWTASDAVKLVTGVTGGGDDTLFVSGDDALCMLIAEAGNGVAAATYSAGAFDVCVHGFETFAEGPTANAIGDGNYRKSLQTQDNVSGGQFPLD